MNVSEVVFRALQTGMCTYTELHTTLGLEAALNIIEVHQVAQYNKDKLDYFAKQDQ